MWVTGRFFFWTAVIVFVAAHLAILYSTKAWRPLIADHRATAKGTGFASDLDSRRERHEREAEEADMAEAQGRARGSRPRKPRQLLDEARERAASVLKESILERQAREEAEGIPAGSRPREQIEAAEKTQAMAGDSRPGRGPVGRDHQGGIVDKSVDREDRPRRMAEDLIPKRLNPTEVLAKDFAGEQKVGEAAERSALRRSPLRSWPKSKTSARAAILEDLAALKSSLDGPGRERCWPRSSDRIPASSLADKRGRRSTTRFLGGPAIRWSQNLIRLIVERRRREGHPQWSLMLRSLPGECMRRTKAILKIGIEVGNSSTEMDAVCGSQSHHGRNSRRRRPSKKVVAIDHASAAGAASGACGMTGRLSSGMDGSTLAASESYRTGAARPVPVEGRKKRSAPLWQRLDWLRVIGALEFRKTWPSVQRRSRRS